MTSDTDYLERIRAAYSEHAGAYVKDLFQSPRFPFTYHHDMVRRICGSDVSRGDVAKATRLRFPGDQEYHDEVCRGAFAYMLADAYAQGILQELMTVDEDELLKIFCILQCMSMHAECFDQKAWLEYFAERREEDEHA